MQGCFRMVWSLNRVRPASVSALRKTNPLWGIFAASDQRLVAGRIHLPPMRQMIVFWRDHFRSFKWPSRTFVDCRATEE
jgi:hypothetical protein